MKSKVGNGVRVECIGINSPHLAAVMELGKQSAGTLGFFPKGAFEEHASRKHIYVALDSNNVCLGYLLYRISRNKVAVVHLCIDPSARGRGVARKLTDTLKADTKHLLGIGLYCRRDYSVNEMWPRLGFTAVHTKPGRGSEPAQLTYWWLSHGHPDLFSVAKPEDEGKQKVVIDANVFFDLYDPTDPESEESKALLAPWLQESLELCLTKEIYNEIDRADDLAERRRHRDLVARHLIVESEDEAVQRLISKLQNYFPTDGSQSDASDLRQIANTIAAEIQVFVTRDTVLRNRCERLYEEFGLTVLHPTELINQLDSVKREGEYQPARLAGSRLKTMLLKSEHEEMATKAFQQDVMGERKSDFQRLLRGHLARPQEFQCQLILDEGARPLVLIVYGRSKTHALEIPLLRVARHPLAPTVVRHLLVTALSQSAHENRTCTRVLDAEVGPVVVGALQEIGFVLSGSVWMKLNLACAESASLMAARLRSLASFSTEVADAVTMVAQAVEDLQRNPAPALAAEVERALWPAKVVDADLPSFIIPIRPQWAQHFFDEDLASQLIFGLRHDLHFGREAVYYRAKQLSGLRCPGRILWYVSQGKSKNGSMSVKACSRLDEIVVGKPKELFKQFRRLGIYEWINVWELAGRNPTEDIMAIRFSDTERLRAPVALGELEKLGVSAPIMSPRPLTKETFAKIYSLGYSVGSH